MDDAELTKLALEIAQDSGLSDTSTNVNIDPTDSWILDLAEEYHTDFEGDALYLQMRSHARPRKKDMRYPYHPTITKESMFSPRFSANDSHPKIESILNLRLPPSPPSIHIPPYIEEEQDYGHNHRMELPPLTAQASLPIFHQRHSITRQVSSIPDFTERDRKLIPNPKQTVRYNTRYGTRRKRIHQRYRSDILLETKYNRRRRVKTSVNKRVRAVTNRISKKNKQCDNEYAVETEYGFWFVTQQTYEERH
eukprot:164813_1